MLFNFNFYSALLLISFSQGIIFSALLLIKGIQNDHQSNKWLSVFVLLCSLYITPWMLGFAGWYENQPYRDILFYVPFLHLFFLGPIIYFYVQSLLNPSFSFSKNHLLHFIPGIMYVLYSIVIWIIDKIVLKEYYFYENQSDKDFAAWYQLLGLLSMLCYFFVSLKYYKFYKKLVFQVTSYANQIVFNWIRNFLYAFLLMLLLRILFFILPFFIDGAADYTGIWWHYLMFSVILYYIALLGYANPVISTIGYKVASMEKRTALLLNNSMKLDDNTIEVDFETIPDSLDEHLQIWKYKVQELIEKEELFKLPDLTILDVAIKLDTNVSLISKTINQGFHLNFNDFINNYRIEAAINAFEKGQHKKTTLLGIAYDSGFNSKATFNRSFKKQTGFSPKEFIENKGL